MKIFVFLPLEVTTTTDATTTSNIFLDENGQFVDASQAAENVSSWWETMDIVGKISEKLPTVILAVVVIVIGWFLSKLLSKLTVKALKARGVDPSVYNFIKRIVSVVVKLASLTAALSMFININSVLAAIGAAGVTAGLGLQSSVAQFASGIQILINHPFKTGDFVEINGITGNVADIRFMYTVITTVDNKRIVVPNSDITTHHIINYSTEANRRVDFKFSVSYTSDIAKAKSILMNTSLENEKILKEPLPEVYVSSYEASSIDLSLRVWCKSQDYWAIYFDMQEKVKYAFDKNGISIPYNQLDVHIVNQ